MKMLPIIFLGFIYNSILWNPTILQDLENGSNSFNATNAILLFLLGISIILNILLIIVIKKDISKKKSPSSKHDDYKKWYEKEQARANKLANEVRAIKGKMHSQVMDTNTNDVSRIKYQKITRESNSFKQDESPKKDEYVIDEKPTSVELEINTSNTIFLPSPFEDCKFSLEDVSDSQKRSSLYKIDLDATNKAGSITLLENADLTKAFNSPAQYLEKACVFENAFSTNAQGIEVLEPGTAVLDYQDWVVTQKIRIKFI